MKNKYISKSLSDLTWIAREILKIISPEKPLLLNGEIGVGKTTLVKYIAKELNIKKIVNSPSFTIMKIYSKLIHIDAYRINGDLEEYYDYFDKNKYIIIEWSNNLQLSFKSYLKINVFLENKCHVFEIMENK